VKSATEAAAGVIVSLEEAWSEVVREMGVRERVYDKWVTEQKLSWADARDRFARMAKAATVLCVIANMQPSDQQVILDAVAAHERQHAESAKAA
jgi:hypothetical protein